MAGLSDIAAGGGFLAGGAVLGVLAGNMRGPDVRALIKDDMELLALLPPEQVERRAELQRVINVRIDDMIVGADKHRSMLEAAQSYRGNWRDIVAFLCAVMYTVVWWVAADHARPHYWVIFVVLIVVSVLAGWYASRGIWRMLRSVIRAGRQDGDEKTG